MPENVLARLLSRRGSMRRRCSAITAIVEPLERRLLFTWIGATSGSTDDAAHQYNNTANWAGGVIDNSFSGVTFTANTTLYFTASLATSATGLNLNYTGNYGLTFMAANTTAETLTLAGNIASGPAGQTVILGDVTNTDDLKVALSGAITANTSSSEVLEIVNVVSGAGTLTASGSGTLLLSGTNTYSGGTLLSSGQLDINNSKAVGSGAFTIDGGTIDNTSGGAITANNNAQTWDGNFTFVGSSSLNMGTGAVTLDANITATISANTFTDGGIIAGAYALTEDGPGTLQLSGANTFSGGMTLSSGQLNVNSAKAVGSGTLTIDGGTIDNTSAGSITLSNNNAQVWDGDFTFIGTENLNLGTGAVTLDSSSGVSVTDSTADLTVAGIIGDGGDGYALTKSGSGSLTLTGSNTYAGGTTVDAGLVSFANGSLGTGEITFGGSSTVQWNGTNTQDISGSIQPIGSGITATFNTNGNNVTMASTLGGAGGIAKAGTGTLTLTGNNTFSGGATLTAGQMNINSATAIGAGTFTIDAGTIDNTSGSAISLSNNNSLVLSGSFTFNGSNALNFGTGAVLLDSNIAETISGSTLTFGGIISDGGNGYGITKAGAGTLLLAGGNTFSGGMTLSGGVLYINNDTAVGSGTFIITAGNIDNTSGSAITLSNNNSLIWGGSFTFNGSNNLNLGTGNVKLNANCTITSFGSILTVGGAISGGYSLTKSGGGTLQLSGNNTYSGGATLTGGQVNINSDTALGTGTITLNGAKIDNTSGSAVTLSNDDPISWASSFTFAGTGNLDMGGGAVTLTGNRTITASASNFTFDGVISGNYNLTKAGGGTLTLTANNTYSGTTTLSAGQLNIDNPGALGTGGFTISGGAIDNTSGSPLTLNNNTQTWNGSFTFVGSNTLNLGTGAVTLSANPTITTSAGNLIVGGVISASHSITKAGTGTLTLGGANTYSAGTTLSAGQLNIDAATAIGGGTFTISGGSLDNTSGSAITLTSNNPQSWSGDFTFVGSNPLNLGTGTVTLTANRNVTVSASTLSVGGVISGAHSLTKWGAGTLALTGANTYSGGTTLEAGVLSFANTSLGTGNITFAASATLQWNGANTQDVSGKIQAIGSGVTATFDTNGNNVTLASALSGGGGIAKIGSGTLTLSAANTFTGGATLSAGQLELANASAIGSGTFTIDGGAFDNTTGSALTLGNAQAWDGNFTFVGSNALNFATGAVILSGNSAVTVSGSTLTIGGAIADGGNGFGVTVAGPGSLVLFGANAYSGGTVLSSGTLVLGNDTSIGTGMFTIDGGTLIAGGAISLTNNNPQAWNGSFAFAGSSALNMGGGGVTLGANVTATITAPSLIVDGNIGDGGNGYSLTEAGTGQLTLAGTNTYSGGTTLSAGQMNINSASAIGTGVFTIDGGTLGNTSGGNITLASNNPQSWNGNFTFASSAALNLGAGTVTLGGNRTVTVSGSTLTVGGIIGDGGNGYSIAATGTGDLALTASNTFSGGFVVGNAETYFADGGLGTGEITFDGGILGWYGTNTQDISSQIQPISGGTVAGFDMNGNNVALASAIGGAGGILVDGLGSLTLSAANTYSGGTDLDIGQLNIDNASAIGTGTLAINGGSLDNTSGSAITLGANNAQTWNADFTFVGSDPLNLGAGAVTMAGSRHVTVSGSTLTIGGVIGDGGSGYSLTKLGAGALNLTAGNSFSGGVTVDAGTLLADNTAGSATGTGAVTINSGATLSGTGTVSGSVTVNSGAALAPGNGGAAIFNTGNLVLESGSNLDIALNGDAAGSGYDQVDVDGSVAIAGSNLDLSGARSAHDGTMLTIIDNEPDDPVVGTFSGLPQGATDSFNGVNYDIDYQGGAGADVVLTADLAATSTTVISSGNPAVFGQTIDLTADVTSTSAGTPTGTVTFYDGVTSLGATTLNASAEATLATSSLAIGSHSITVVYSGDSNFTTSTSSVLSQAVDQDSTSATVSSSQNPSVFGESVEFTATVAADLPGSGTPTGTVTFFDGSTPLGTETLNVSDQATFTTAGLSVASHSISAVYNGDSNFSTSTSSSLSQLVNKDSTTSTVSPSMNPSVFGQSITLSATVAAELPGSGLPTGTVTFMDGSTSLGTETLDASDEAMLTTAGLAVGSDSITAVYNGDSNFDSDTSSAISQTVDQDATTTTVASSANPSVSGQSITLTAEVTASSPGSGTPTGTVTFLDGSTSLGTDTLNGSAQATLAASGLAVGSHSITVIYSGDSDFSTSTSSVLAQTVNQDATSSAVSSSLDPSEINESVTFTATVTADVPGSGTPTGTVTFMDGATALGPATLDGSGQATLTTSSLTVGSHSITAVYGGDMNFSDSTSTILDQVINPSATVKLVFDQQPGDTTAGSIMSPSITINVEDSFGDIVTNDNSEVTLSVSGGPGQLNGTLTVQASGGVASFDDLSIDTAGAYTLSANDGSLTSATSDSFEITPAAASQLAFDQQPTQTLVNNAIAPSVTVMVEDAFGNLVTSDTSTVSVALASGTGSLAGTLAASAVGGVASFSDLSIGSPGDYVLSATDGSLTQAMSNSFAVISPRISIGSQPTTATAGAAGPIVIDITSSGGGIDTQFNSPVTLSVLSGPAGGLSGTVSVTAENGVATFSDAQLTIAGDYVLAVSSIDGLIAETSPITISPGPVRQVDVTQQANASWQFSTISPAIVIAQRDQFGNLVTSGSSNITASIVSGPAGAVLSGGTTVTTVNGYATFDDLSVNMPGVYSLAFSNGTDAPTIISGLDIVSIPARRYLFNGSPLSLSGILLEQRNDAAIYAASGPPTVGTISSNDAIGPLFAGDVVMASTGSSAAIPAPPLFDTISTPQDLSKLLD